MHEIAQGLGSLVERQRTGSRGDDPVLVFRGRQVATRQKRLEEFLRSPLERDSAEAYIEALDSYHRSAERFLDALVLGLQLPAPELQAASRRGRRRLQEALVVRRHLADFRFLAGRAAEKHTPDLQLRYAATGIARLLGSDARGLLRAHDERVLLDIQGRLRQWFLGDSTGLDAGRLLGDLSGVGRILSQVNHREELILRDTELVRALPEHAVNSRGLMARVHELYGLSYVVDAVLKQNEPIETTHLDRLRREVGWGSAAHT